MKHLRRSSYHLSRAQRRLDINVDERNSLCKMMNFTIKVFQLYIHFLLVLRLLYIQTSIYEVQSWCNLVKGKRWQKAIIGDSSGRFKSRQAIRFVIFNMQLRSLWVIKRKFVISFESLIAFCAAQIAYLHAAALHGLVNFTMNVCAKDYSKIYKYLLSDCTKCFPNEINLLD